MPRAGDAGLDQHSRGVQLAIALVLFRQWRTWTYHAHVSYEHIEELRQFIYGETTNEMTDFRDSRVILHLEDEAVLLAGLFSQLGLQLVCIRNHRTEFDHLERHAAQTDARLRVENRTAISQLDGYGHRHGDEQRQQNRDEGDNQVECAFGNAHRRRVLRQSHGNHRVTLDGAHRSLMARSIGRRCDQGDLQTQ